MDIQRAKEEIKQTVRAYLACDDTGSRRCGSGPFC